MVFIEGGKQMVNIQQTYTILVNMDELNNEYSYLVASKKPRDIFNKTKTNKILHILALVFLTIYSFNRLRMVVGIVRAQYSFFKKMSFFFSEIIQFLMVAVLILIVVFVLKLLVKIINKIFSIYKMQTTKHREKINNIDKEINNLKIKYGQFQDALSASIVPQEYRNINTVAYIIKVMNQGRATTIGEAINLYEFEKQQNEQLQTIREMENKYDQAQNEIESLKRQVKKANKNVRTAQNKADSAYFHSFFKK